MFDGLLKSKFQTKCKSSIKLTSTRIEMIKKKRSATQKYLKNDIADLLKNGLDSNAYSRVEGYLGEMNLSSCYECVELSCLCISNHLSVMSKNRECPEECREAVSNLMFAAARFADLPELRELRSLFAERYGKSVESYANKEFVANLKSAHHTKETKLQLLQDIAHESGIEWNSKALEQKLYKPPVVEQVSSNNTGDDRSKQNNPRGTAGGMKQDISSDIKEEGRHDGHEIQKNKRTPGNGIQAKKMDHDVQQSILDSAKSSSRKEVDEDKSHFSYSSIPPPYTRRTIIKTDPTTDVLPNGSDNKGVKPTKLDDQADNESKPKAKSVRRRPAKHLDPPSGHNNIRSFKEQEDAIQYCCDQSDEEERKMDKLLIHYSNNSAPPEPSKQEPRSRRKEFTFQSRAASLPLETTNPVDTKRGYIRSTSYEPDMTANGHIHPKLPDYDDFVARLAALRGEGK